MALPLANYHPRFRVNPLSPNASLGSSSMMLHWENTSRTGHEENRLPNLSFWERRAPVLQGCGGCSKVLTQVNHLTLGSHIHLHKCSRATLTTYIQRRALSRWKPAFRRRFNTTISLSIQSKLINCSSFWEKGHCGLITSSLLMATHARRQAIQQLSCSSSQVTTEN